MKTSIFALLPLLLITGCLVYSEPDIPDHIREMENVTVIPADDELPELELQRGETYGSSEEVIVSEISRALVDEQGRVYIVDSDRKVIHVFRPDGSYLTEMGGEGRGPGEFQLPGSAEIRGGFLYVQDFMLRRINHYDLESMSFVSTIPLSPKNQDDLPHLEDSNASQFLVISDSTLLVGFRKPGSIMEMDEDRPIYFHVMNHEGQILPDSRIELLDRQFTTLNYNGQPRVTLFPFNHHYMIEVSDDGHIYTAGNGQFLIREHDGTGAYQRAFYHAYPHIPIERSALLREYDNEMHRRMIRESELPENWPVLSSLDVDDENRLWVSVIGEGGDDSQWWVLDKSGERLGRFTMPENRSLTDIRNGSIYLRERDENDVTTLVRYQVF